MKYGNKKDITFNIFISLIFSVVISLITVSHHFLYKVTDFKIGDAAPINLLVPPFSGFKVPIAGETIMTRLFWIKKGEIITKYQLEPLNMFFKDTVTEFVVYLFFSFLILVFFLNLSNSITRFKKVILLALILFVTVFAKFTATYSAVSIYSFPFIGMIGFMLIFFEKRAIMSLNMALSFIISVIYNFNPFILFSFAISGGISLFLYKKDEKDIDYIMPFIVGSFLLALIVSTFDFFFNQSVYLDLINISWSLSSLPFFYFVIQLLKVHSPFFQVYDIMNYMDLEHELLKMVQEKAPGTYQHSLNMANLAETAANSIGANGFLCRVGAYFHDIGKIKHPEYFIENQEGENPHDSLSPKESARMIKLHVTDGLKLAEEYKLPKYITQFIDKHHGTTILEYFYDKAAKAEGGNVNIEDFRYPGRKPDNKETAILMIVDAVEAASRTLNEPTKEDIENLVNKIVFNKLLYNQLNLSGLTLSDLRKIIVSLVDNLKSNTHSRIKYPWQIQKQKEKKEI